MTIPIPATLGLRMEDRMFRQSAKLTPLQTMGVLAMLFRFYHESQSNGMIPDTPQHRMLINDALETQGDALIEALLDAGVLLKSDHGGSPCLMLYGWEAVGKKENVNQVRGAHAKNIHKKMLTAAKCAEAQLELLRTETDDHGNPILNRVVASELHKKLAYAFLLGMCAVIDRVAPTTPAATLDAMVAILETVRLENEEQNKETLIWCRVNHREDYRLRADLITVIRYWPSLLASAMKQEAPQTRGPEPAADEGTGQLFAM